MAGGGSVVGDLGSFYNDSEGTAVGVGTSSVDVGTCAHGPGPATPPPKRLSFEDVV